MGEIEYAVKHTLKSNLLTAITKLMSSWGLESPLALRQQEKKLFSDVFYILVFCEL